MEGIEEEEELWGLEDGRENVEHKEREGGSKMDLEGREAEGSSMERRKHNGPKWRKGNRKEM